MLRYMRYIVLALCMVSLNFTIQGHGNYSARYEEAYGELLAMLEKKKPLSLRRGVFMAEWAYLDGNLDYERDFCHPIKEGANYMKRLIRANKWEKYKTSKQIALCNFFFYPCSGNRQTPFRYDFDNQDEDDWGRQLVSATLKTHKGQCHSMPWAYMLYAEELGADVSIAHAPRHCFIMYKDLDDLFPEDWVNVEVTAQQYQSSFWIKQHFEITDEAIASGTYLSPLTREQTIACQLADLAFGYWKKCGKYDDFTLKCANKALEYYMMNPTAIIIKTRSLEAILLNHLKMNGGYKDKFTDSIDHQLRQCIIDLEATHWTPETEERRKKWSNNKK